jgi:hypothetical protein
MSKVAEFVYRHAALAVIIVAFGFAQLQLIKHGGTKKDTLWCLVCTAIHRALNYGPQKIYSAS